MTNSDKNEKEKLYTILIRRMTSNKSKRLWAHRKTTANKNIAASGANIET